MFTPKKHIKLIFLLLLLCGSTATATATEVDYSVGIAISKYDNVNLEQNPNQGGVSESVRGTVTIAEDTATLVANLNASLEAINYQGNQFSNENVGGVGATALWSISPGRFEWFVSDAFTQTLANIFASDAPNNRRNTNAFSTGPNFILRISSRHSLNLEARVETTAFGGADAFDSPNADNDRVELASSWIFQLRSTSSLSLNHIAETVNFDDDVLNTNFDRSDLFLNYTNQSGLNTFEIGLGVTRLSYIDLEDVDEARFNLSILNSRTRTSTIQLELNSNLTDASSELLDQAQGVADNIDSELSTADIYLNKMARMSYNKTLASGSFNIDISRENIDYQQQNQQDQEVKEMLFSYFWDINGPSEFSFTAQYTNSYFNNVSREDEDYLYTVLYRYNARRNISVGLETTAQERTSSDSTSDYDDFSVVLSLTYNTQ